MKLFGNSKSDGRKYSSQKKEPDIKQRDISDSPEVTKSVSASKALLLLISSAAMLVLCISLSITLIGKSSVVSAETLYTSKPSSLEYKVDASAPVEIKTELDVEAPSSLYDSSKLNLLILVPDDQKQTVDAIMLLSLDTSAKTVSLLSVPRDTYIAGNYEIPKAMYVYHAEEDSQKGIRAMTEMVKGMFGFKPDHYLVLNQDALSMMVDEIGGLRFDIPSDPDFSQLPVGERTINGKDAIKLFSYDESYTDVETEPARVQRTFLQLILDRFVDCDDSTLMDRSIALKAASVTDLNEKQLAYYGLLLQEIDILGAYSRALPGGEIEIKDVLYYQVNSEKALDIINEQINPLDKALDEFDLNFRQLTGDSGDGEYSDYGFGDGNNYTGGGNNSGNSGDDDDEDSTDETDETVDIPFESEPETDETIDIPFESEPETDETIDIPFEPEITETP